MKNYNNHEVFVAENCQDVKLKAPSWPEIILNSGVISRGFSIFLYSVILGRGEGSLSIIQYLTEAYICSKDDP